ncbi:MAG: sensor histidine kinase, partial [Prochlorothrix sp.]
VKISSFRLRIAFLATGLAGIAVLGFGSLAWQLIYSAKLNRVDIRLENHMRQFVHLPPTPLWPVLAANLSRQLGTEEESSTAIWLVDRDGNSLYQSAQWVQVDPKTANSSPNSSSSSPNTQNPSLNLFPPPPPPSSDPDPPPFSPFDPRRQRQRPPLPPNLALQFSNQPSSYGQWRIAAASFPSHRVAIAVNLNSINQEMASIRQVFLVTVPITLFFVAFGAWWLSGRALGPIHSLTTAMQQTTITGLDRPLSAQGTDLEFATLIGVYNQMLERLDRSFKQASRFSADAAHELRTPLAILQGELELAIQEATDHPALQETLASLLEEVRRLSGIVRKLLFLSLADAGQMGIQATPLNLAELIPPLLEDIELLAPDLTFESEIEADLPIQGDRDLLTQVLQNLISNAIKYNLPQGWIRLRAIATAHQVQVQISNASREMAAGDRSQIFNRFYRADPSRNRQIEGLGLGLSLAWEMVQLHRGQLRLDPPQPAQTSFTLVLPRNPTP